MSDAKNKIREAIMAFSQGEREEGHSLLKEVMKIKGYEQGRATLEGETSDVDESSYMASGKKHMRAAHRHMNAGKKDMQKKRDMHRDNKKEGDHVKEEQETGANSSVMRGTYDYDIHDPTKRKGSVKKTGKIDHKDYDDDKANAYKKKDAVSKKPVNEEMSEDEIKAKINALQKEKVNTNGHGKRARIQDQIDSLESKLKG